VTAWRIIPAETRRKRKSGTLIAAIFTILWAGAIGCTIPVLGRWFPAVSLYKDYFFCIKTFAAGDILATGFIHILPDALEKLTSPCLPQSPRQDFPFGGFVAMVAALGAYMTAIKVQYRVTVACTYLLVITVLTTGSRLYGACLKFEL
jgi:ZIP Zinc transporter